MVVICPLRTYRRCPDGNSPAAIWQDRAGLWGRAGRGGGPAAQGGVTVSRCHGCDGSGGGGGGGGEVGDRAVAGDVLEAADEVGADLVLLRVDRLQADLHLGGDLVGL